MTRDNHKMSYKRGIEIPISIVLFAIVGLMVFTILLGFIPKVIGGLLGAFLGQTSAMQAQSLDDARGICQEWCANAKLASSPERFLNSKYCKSLVAIPASGGSACLLQQIPNSWGSDKIYIYGGSIEGNTSSQGCKNNTNLLKLQGNTIYFPTSAGEKCSSTTQISNVQAYCGRQADKIKCVVSFSKVPSSPVAIKQICLAYQFSGDVPVADKYAIIINFKDTSYTTGTENKPESGYKIVDCETPTPSSIGSGNNKVEVIFKDPCSGLDRNQCTGPCKWTAVSGYVTKHCYEPPISVQCSTPPITIGTVTYTCSSTENGCICTGSDGTILK